jgi:hypothetical protein
MTDASAPAPPTAAKLEIPLNEISEKTKDFLLASGAAGGKSVAEVMVETLDGAAVAAGFLAGPTPNHAAA